MFGYNEYQIYESDNINKKNLLTLVTENLQNHLFIYLLFISGFGKISPVKKKKEKGC